MAVIGRPLIFATPDELWTSVLDYIQNEKKPTLSGLAYHLGIDRQTLYNYKERPEFFDIIKKATDYVEHKYEERLIYESNPTGVIFALKNMGWSDKTEVKNEHSGEVEMIFRGMNYIKPNDQGTEDKPGTDL